MREEGADPSRSGAALGGALDRYFSISARGSSLTTEIAAGFSTFFALSYIVFVNPAILSEGGIDRDAAFFATAIVAGLATVAVGVWARLPFAVAPGMEMNAFVAFFMVETLGYSWQMALGAVFWSGIAFLLFSLSGLRRVAIEAVPIGMRKLLSLIVGVFILLVALRICGVLTYDPGVGVSVEDMQSTEFVVLVAGVIVILVLERLGLRVAVLPVVLASAAFLHATGSVEAARPMNSARFLDAAGGLDIRAIAEPGLWGAILTLFLIDFYGSVAKLLGIGDRTGLLDAQGLTGVRQALIVDSSATVAGALVGTSNSTVYVESAVGIAAGGRTGIVAVVCGLALLGCLFLHPFAALIPATAAGGALCYVAWKLVPARDRLRQMDLWEWASMASAVLVLVATFSVEKAFLIAALGYFLRGLLRERVVNWFLAVSVLLLGAISLLQAT